jgi:hypothetical protein
MLNEERARSPSSHCLFHAFAIRATRARRRWRSAAPPVKSSVCFSGCDGLHRSASALASRSGIQRPSASFRVRVTIRSTEGSSSAVTGSLNSTSSPRRDFPTLAFGYFSRTFGQTISMMSSIASSGPSPPPSGPSSGYERRSRTRPLSASLTGLLTIACATLPERNHRSEPSMSIADSATRSRRSRAFLSTLSSAAIFFRTSSSRMSSTSPISAPRVVRVVNRSTVAGAADGPGPAAGVATRLCAWLAGARPCCSCPWRLLVYPRSA